MPLEVAPRNVTEHVPLAERTQVAELRDPPVVPGVRVKVIVPDGT